MSYKYEKGESRYIFDLDKRNSHTDQDAKAWVESNFPKENYGKEIYPGKCLPLNKEELDDFWFEAWDLRALFEQAYMAGKENQSDKLSSLEEQAQALVKIVEHTQNLAVLPDNLQKELSIKARQALEAYEAWKRARE